MSKHEEKWVVGWIAGAAPVEWLFVVDAHLWFDAKRISARHLQNMPPGKLLIRRLDDLPGVKESLAERRRMRRPGRSPLGRAAVDVSTQLAV